MFVRTLWNVSARVIVRLEQLACARADGRGSGARHLNVSILMEGITSS